MKDNIMKISITTTISPDGKIFQKLCREFNDQKTDFIQTIFDTKEKQIREALIKLGWMPPRIESKGPFFHFENDLDGVKRVIWAGQVYDVGNRRHKQTELYHDGKFITIVDIRHLKPYEYKEI